jgi:hypothetical protein
MFMVLTLTPEPALRGVTRLSLIGDKGKLGYAASPLRSEADTLGRQR